MDHLPAVHGVDAAGGMGYRKGHINGLHAQVYLFSEQDKNPVSGLFFKIFLYNNGIQKVKYIYLNKNFSCATITFYPLFFAHK
jgi:hypothetical protein